MAILMLWSIVGPLLGLALGAPGSYESERRALEALHGASRFDALTRAGLSAAERRLDEALAKMKRQEQTRRDANGSIIVRQPFARIRGTMLQSPLYRLLQKMPKGAILHAHWDSMASVDWLVEVATYEEHLWFNASAGTFRFGARRPGEGFELVSELRRAEPRGARAFDDALKKRLASAPERFEPWGDPWKHFQGFFTATSGLLSYAPLFEKYIRKLFSDAVSVSRLVHLELRMDSDVTTYELDGRTASSHATIAKVRAIAAEFAQRLSVRLILAGFKPGLPPADLPSVLRQTAELKGAFPDLVAGFDLVGQEDVSPPLAKYAPALLNSSLPYFLHAGETGDSGTGSAADNLVDAALLARRIGHGTALVKRPELVPALKERSVAVEVCPISNQVLGYVQDLRNHPAIWMMEQGLAVTLSPDDPGALGYDDVAADWWVALVAWGDSDLATLKQLALNSLQHSALDGADKLAALSRWHEQWERFIGEQLASAQDSASGAEEGFIV